MIKNLLFVGIGGFSGSIMRYLVYYLVEKRIQSLPVGTFTVNVLGSLLLGLFMGYAIQQQQESNVWRLLFAVGFCGSFTTFSTFILDSYQLTTDRQLVTSILYVSISFAIGLCAIIGGLWLGRHF